MKKTKRSGPRTRPWSTLIYTLIGVLETNHQYPERDKLQNHNLLLSFGDERKVWHWTSTLKVSLFSNGVILSYVMITNPHMTPQLTHSRGLSETVLWKTLLTSRFEFCPTRNACLVTTWSEFSIVVGLKPVRWQADGVRMFRSETLEVDWRISLKRNCTC